MNNASVFSTAQPELALAGWPATGGLPRQDMQLSLSSMRGWGRERAELRDKGYGSERWRIMNTGERGREKGGGGDRGEGRER